MRLIYTSSINNPDYRHLERANFVFVDGHVATLSFELSALTNNLWKMRE